jgi:hypothetical protein
MVLLCLAPALPLSSPSITLSDRPGPARHAPCREATRKKLFTLLGQNSPMEVIPKNFQEERNAREGRHLVVYVSSDKAWERRHLVVHFGKLSAPPELRQRVIP